MGRRLKNISNSPLGKPDRLIFELANLVKDKVFLPNADSLYVVLGTIAGNVLKGEPVWLMLVGPPSSGKTMLLNMCYIDKNHHMPKMYSIDMIESIGALLSGTPKKDSKGGTGGVLNSIGDHNAMLFIKDFTSMLSMPHDAFVKVVGALRRVYDGYFDRPIGTDGGKILQWSGKVGLLTACTNSIDTHHGSISELGQRWMYYRMDDSDGYGETMSALKNTDPKATMRELYHAVKEFLETVGVDYKDAHGLDARPFTELESNRLYCVGVLSTKARSPVVRDWKTKEISAVPETEDTRRMSRALGQLYLGLEIIGLDERDRWRIVTRVASDSIPRLRQRIIRESSKGREVKIAPISELVHCGRFVVKCALEDLECHGIMEQGSVKNNRFGDGKGTWRLTGWAKKYIKLGWGGDK